MTMSLIYQLCPFCGKAIRREAIYCRLCKRDLPTLTAEEEAVIGTDPNTYVCTLCKHVGRYALVQKGRSAITAILLLTAGIVPGLIYILWRRSPRQKCCELCRSIDVVPARSLAGKRLAMQVLGGNETTPNQ